MTPTDTLARVTFGVRVLPDVRHDGTGADSHESHPIPGQHPLEFVSAAGRASPASAPRHRARTPRVPSPRAPCAARRLAAPAASERGMSKRRPRLRLRLSRWRAVGADHCTSGSARSPTSGAVRGRTSPGRPATTREAGRGSRPRAFPRGHCLGEASATRVPWWYSARQPPPTHSQTVRRRVTR